MVASPNGGYFVQGGEGTDGETAGPAGSAAIGQVLADQLAKTGGKVRAITSVSARIRALRQ
jgi:aminopeptidase S